MKTYTVRFRIKDKRNFDEIKKGIKTVETRAASERYQEFQKGDRLRIICGRNIITKNIKHVQYFKTLEEMAKTVGLKKIMPEVKTLREARTIYFSYPGYREKLKKYGLVALTLGN